MMKDAQKEMDDLDPEMKHMMDSMGVTVPSFTSVPQVTDAQLQQAYEDESRIVPRKDVSRIASIPKSSLTNASLPAFVSTTHGKVTQRLHSPSKTKGQDVYQLIKSQNNSPSATGNSAAALWMMGKAELALYVMGKACIDNPTDADNLNNYAAMLSMSGAEELALPLLDYVNKRFPKNSTVLNNIGQAWFGLGDIEKSNAYLDSVIRIYAYHPQANYTKSFIEESKDHSSMAIDAAKRSIRNAYSRNKEERLSKLGYKPVNKDLKWHQPMPQDALGLENFKWPAYPKNVLESEVAEKEWSLFKESCKQELATLRSQQKSLEDRVVKSNASRTQQMLQAGQKGMHVSPLPPLAFKAMIKLQYLVDDKDGHQSVSFRKKGQAVADAYRQAGALDEKLSAQLAALQKKYEDQFGEGKPNPFEAACKDENTASNSFLNAANTILEQASRDYLDFLRKKLNNDTYYYQYTQWPEQFELTWLNAKITWLTSIADQKVMFKNKSSWCQTKTEPKAKPLKLAAFDDVHCVYHSTFTTPVGSMKMDCSKWTTTLDLQVVKLGLKQDMDKETFGDQFMNCSVEVGVGVGVGGKAGPLKAEASVSGAIAAEFDRNGLSDLVIKTSAGISGGTDIISEGSMAGVGVSDLSLDVGVQGQISLISGKSFLEGSGLLQGISKQ